MPRSLIPPKYISVPVGIVYDTAISPVVRDTYLQLRGLAWGDSDDETPEISVKKLCELTGKSRTTIYGHLAILRASGWLLFSSAHHSGLTVRFIADAEVHNLLSENPDLLNDDGLTDITLTKIIKHPPVNKKNRAGSVRKSGQVSENPDSSNGWHEVIDAELEQLLEQIGVYRVKFLDVAASGWSTDQLKKLARAILQDFEAGKGGGVYIWRIMNTQPPETDEQYRQKYVTGEWAAYVEH